MLRFGLIGHGRFGKHYERLLGDMPGVELAAIATRHTAISVADILADPRIDAVVIATPASTHADVIMQALCAKKHILVEKPMVMATSDVDMLRPLLTDNIFMVGYQYLFNDGVRALAGTAAEVYLGEHLSDGPIRDDVDVFWDAGVHDLSIIEYLFHPGSVTNARGTATPDRADVMVTYASGLVAYLLCSRVFTEKVRRITLLNSRGGTLFDDRVTCQAREPLRNQLEHFIECIRTGHQPLTNFDFGARITKNCEEILHSIAQRE